MSTGGHIPSKLDARFPVKSLFNHEECKKSSDCYRTAKDYETLPNNPKVMYGDGPLILALLGKRELCLSDTDSDDTSDETMTCSLDTKRIKTASESSPSLANTEPRNKNSTIYATEYNEQQSNYDFKASDELTSKTCSRDTKHIKTTSESSPSLVNTEPRNKNSTIYATEYNEQQSNYDFKASDELTSNSVVNLERIRELSTSEMSSETKQLNDTPLYATNSTARKIIDSATPPPRYSFNKPAVETIEINYSEITKRNRIIIGKMYSCPLCRLTFTDFSAVNSHYKHHSYRGRYRCKHCTYGTDREDDILAHSKCHEMLQQSIRREEGDYYNFKRPFPINNNNNNAMALSSELRKPLSSSEIRFSNGIIKLRPTEEIGRPESYMSNSPNQKRSSGSSQEQIGENVSSINKKNATSEYSGGSFLSNDDTSLKEKLDYRCSKCPAILSSRYCLKRHTLLHGSDAPYKCSRCDLAVKTFPNLIQHEKFQHQLSSDQLSSFSADQRSNSDDNNRKVNDDGEQNLNKYHHRQEQQIEKGNNNSNYRSSCSLSVSSSCSLSGSSSCSLSGSSSCSLSGSSSCSLSGSSSCSLSGSSSCSLSGSSSCSLSGSSSCSLSGSSSCSLSGSSSCSLSGSSSCSLSGSSSCSLSGSSSCSLSGSSSGNLSGSCSSSNDNLISSSL